MKIAIKASIIAKMGRIAFALALPLVNAESAQAIIQVENLSETRNSSLFISSSLDHGSSFTTGSDDYTLNSVIARFRELAESDLKINLYSDASGIPGTSIGQLSTTEDILSGFNEHLFTPDTPITLTANTTYWLIGNTPTGNYAWGGTNSFSETSPGTWTIGDGNVSSDDGGTSWEAGDFIITPTQFSVDASSSSASVPFEFSPAMGLLLVGGLFGGKAAYGKYQASKVKLED